MVDIVACYVVCNEQDSIAESIRSVKAYVDRFVIIDAAFLSSPLPPEVTHSTDLTHQVATQICAAEPSRPLHYVEAAARLPQFYARNAYLEFVQPPDWVFVLDGDEIFYGNHLDVQTTFEKIRTGSIKQSLALPVYTTAVLADKMAPDITPDEFAQAPLISAMGYAPRLFAAAPNLRYLAPLGTSTPTLTYIGEPGGWPSQPLWPVHNASPDSIFLINHHVRQTYQGYLDDYAWSTGQVIR